MKDFENNNLLRFPEQNQNPFREKRTVWMSPVEQQSEKPAAGPGVDINKSDFDNLAFKNESRENFEKMGGSIDQTIKNLLKKLKVENKELTEDQINLLSGEFREGLQKSVADKWTSIADKIKQPASPAPSPADALDKFQNGLKDLNCIQIGLVHDNSDDTTKFKFYSKTGEIVFPATDIAIQYVPKQAREAVAGMEQEKGLQQFTVAKNAPKDRMTGGIDNLKFLESQGVTPKDGDWVEVIRGTNKIKAQYVEKDKKFITEAKTPLWLIAGDKIEYRPKAVEKPAAQIDVNIDGTPYGIVQQIDLPAGTTYLQVAEAIINNKGKLNNQPLVEDETVTRVTRTKISVPEYAELLKKAHDAMKGQRLPIIIPEAPKGRKEAGETKREQQETKVRTEREQAASKATDQYESKKALHTIQMELYNRDPEKWTELKALIAEYDAKLAAVPKNSEQFNELWEEFWDKMEGFFKNAGLSRSVSNETYLAMKAGKDSSAWKEMWDEKNPGAQKIINIIGKNPKVFTDKEQTKPNMIRNNIWKLVYDTGDGQSFDSEDIINTFGIKLPNEMNYEDVLALAAAPDTALKTPALKSLKSLCDQYGGAIEELANAIHDLNPSLTRRGAGKREHEKLSEKAPDFARDLKTMVDLLNVDSSTAIKQEDERNYSCIVEKSGKRLMLRSTKTSAGQTLSVLDPDNGTPLMKEYDYGRLDQQDYIDKINSIFNTMAKSVTAERAGEKPLAEIALTPNSKPTFHSLRDLESLNKGIPGMPVKDLLETGKTGGTRFGFDIDNLKNTLTDGLKTALTRMGVLNSAKFVDSPANRVEMQGNDSALVNVRYRGKDLTMKFENTTAGYNVYIASGFNQPADKMTQVHSEWGSMDSQDDFIKTMDEGVNKLPANAAKMETQNQNSERITASAKCFTDFNNKLAEYAKSVGYKVDLSLTYSQFVEAVFRSHSFADLKTEGCVAKVKGQEKAFILTSLPAKLQDIGHNLQLLQLVYSIKFGTVGDRSYVNLTSAASEKARESVDTQQKYEHRLKQLFAYGLTDFDQEGRKVTMGDTGVGRESTTYSSKDEYFKKASGNAAYNEFQMSFRRFDANGREIMDVPAANKRLNDLFQKGLAKMDMLKRNQQVYGDLAKDVEKAGLRKRAPLDLNQPDDFTDLEAKIIRLGYLSFSEMQELEQTKAVEKAKEQLIANILTLLPETIEGPNGEKIPKAKAAASLNQLPFSLLLSYSYDSNTDTHNGGLHVPFILDVFDSKYAKLVIAPSVGPKGVGVTVGMSFTSKDPEWKDQRVIFFGGVGMTAHVGTENSLGASISGGVDFKVCKADEQDDFNYYIGVNAGLAVDIAKNPFNILGGGVNLKMIQWEIDAQQSYTNKLNTRFENEKVKTYIDQLKQIYKDGSKPEAIKNFCDSIKGNKALAEKLGLNTEDLAAGNEGNVLLKFEQYIGSIVEDFNEKFDLPLVTGGEISFGVTHGVLLASGAVTGNVPLILGTVIGWGVQFLASLNFNVGSRMVMTREQRSSEGNMEAFNDMNTQEQFDKAFTSFRRDTGSQEYYTSGRNLNTKEGGIRTEMGKSNSANLEINNFETQLGAFNETLAAKNIPMRIQSNPDKTMEVILLNSQAANNERILFSPDVATVVNGRIFLKNPNALTNLYFNQQSRVYPLETSHGATIETIITVSNNRFNKAADFPTEFSVTRLADNKDKPVFGGEKVPAGAPESYKRIEINRVEIKADQDKMANALNQSQSQEAKENIRPDLKEQAKRILAYTNSKRETFISITNDESKENLENPNYFSQKLHSFYQDFAKDKKAEPFNAHEMRMLTLELSTLRYTEMMNSATGVTERARVFEERMKWAEKTLTPYFDRRIAEINAQLEATGKPKITHTGKELALKATQDLLYMSTKMPKTELPPGTSVFVAIGRGANGLNQILDGSKNAADEAEKGMVDQYGYIMGKDYTNIIRKAEPGNLDYEIGLILMGQLSKLPETKDVKNFMDSSLARKLASNGGLRFILGKQAYDEVISHYNSPSDTASAGVTKFMEVVKQVREAQLAGRESITVTGEKGVKFLLRVVTNVQSGIFNRCGNFSSIITEDVVIMPPPIEDAMGLFAAGSEARTTLNVQTYKEFLGLFGGVTAAVTIPTGGPGAAPASTGGSGGETGGTTGSGQGGTVEAGQGAGTAETGSF